MHTLITGLNFLLQNIPEHVTAAAIVFGSHRLMLPLLPYSESFTFSPDPARPNPREFVSHLENPFPYLLVNIGSGVRLVTTRI